eukprot:SAG22_NODE_1537_length_4188_cov_108.843238_1_plen_134_part_00
MRSLCPVKAAEAGHTNAMNWLAHLYEKGDPVRRKALPLCCASTVFLSKTVRFRAVPLPQDGIAASGETAVEYNRQAAEAGDSWALTKMGMRCLKGEGVPQDDLAARQWLERAAANGSKQALAKLTELDADDLD